MEDAKDPSGFEVFHWKGQKRYKCPREWEDGSRCSYDTYDLQQMAQHLRDPHNREGKIPKRPQKVIHESPILNSSGKPFLAEVSPDLRSVKFKE
jgi:hypothetical protein